MRVGYIILCRYNSSRLPGKILKPINGKPLLKILLERLSALRENIWVATSNEATDDVIADYCKSNAVNFFRGSLNNVAERFLNCALHNDLDYAVRINGDNLFADAKLIQNITCKATEGDFDFTSNVPGRTFATGMSVEVMKTSFYQQAYQAFQHDERYCQHVTLFFYEQTDKAGRTLFVKNNDLPEAIGVKMAIDTQEDFDEARSIINNLGKDYKTASWKEIIREKIRLHEQLAG